MWCNLLVEKNLVRSVRSRLAQDAHCDKKSTAEIFCRFHIQGHREPIQTQHTEISRELCTPQMLIQLGGVLEDAPDISPDWEHQLMPRKKRQRNSSLTNSSQHAQKEKWIIESLPHCSCGCRDAAITVFRQQMTSDLRISQTSEDGRQTRESGIVCGEVTSSTCCPVTRKRMVVPARLRSCKHLQCFDAAAVIHLAKTIQRNHAVEHDVMQSQAFESGEDGPSHRQQGTEVIEELQISCPLMMCGQQGPEHSLVFDRKQFDLLHEASFCPNGDQYTIFFMKESVLKLQMPVVVHHEVVEDIEELS